jgi:ubiquinone/menaquinone biosynthesis C-methylase UbiE
MNDREFWQRQAKDFGRSVTAVNYDPLEEELEFLFLGRFFRDGEKILDLGCGNGRTTLFLAENFPDALVTGVDFVPEMIEIAREEARNRGVKNVTFSVHDASLPGPRGLSPGSFDKILTKRLLINLKGEKKFTAIENIHALLADGGRYIMVECFREPLDRVNAIRREFSLEPIQVKEFNEYLEMHFLEAMAHRFVVEEVLDFESLYYFISRIFNATLSQGTPDYHAPMNRLAVAITGNHPAILQGYGPELLHVLRKR